MTYLFHLKHSTKTSLCFVLAGLVSLTALPGYSRSVAAGTAPAPCAPDGQARVSKTYGSLPLSFELNQGQTDRRVKFLSRGSGYTFFLTANEAVMAFAQPAPREDRGDLNRGANHGASGRRSVVRMRLEGSNAAPQVKGLEEMSGRSHYFSGDDPQRWRANIPHYARVRYGQVYPGIDMVYYGNGRELEYDFVLAPGADPCAIGLAFSGADQITLNADGDLVLQTEAGRLRQRRPVAYQDVRGVRREVACRYVLKGESQVGLRVGAYDASAPLVISGALAYSTYLGGSYIDYGNAIAVDAAGNAYVTGQTTSVDFPTTSGAITTTSSGNDAFITKINAAGDTLVYSTYLRGADGTGIAVDATGNAYVTGDVGYLGFPVTPGAFQTPQWGYDTFITKLSASGALVYSSRFGGGFDDFGRAIAIDRSGNAYITGWTVCRASSCDFPTVNAFQPRYGGGNNDAFVTKMNANGTALVYSTYLGGGSILNATDDWGEGIAVDGAGSAYVTGYTYSPDFPVTAGAYDTSRLGLDAFVTKFTPDGSALVYSTFLGGNGRDLGRAIAVDAAGNAYVTGETESQDNPFTPENDGFPVTPGAFQTTGSFDAFVTKLNPQGSALVYSTYLGGGANDSGIGGNGVDRAWGIAVDAAGNAYVAGDTQSPYFPVVNAIQPSESNPPDAFVTELNPTGSAPVFSTYLGGSLTDQARGIAVDAAGAVYVVGSSSSTNFPVTPGAFRTINAGYDDAFVVKLTNGGGATNWLTALSINPALVTAGSPSQGAVSLSGPAPAGGAVVSLTNGRPDIATIPATVSVAAGATGATFTITTGPSFWVGRAAVLITGTYGGVTRSGTLEVDAAPPSVTLSGVTLNPTSVTGGNASTATVTLSAPAPAGGISVGLTSNNTAVATVPASVSVAAGASTATFTVTTRAVTSPSSATITAAYGGVSRSATLTVTAPPPADTVTITRAEYTGSKRELRVEASGSNAGATLRVYVTSTGALIGTLTNSGGKYAGQFTLASNPQNITVRSSLGGQATKAVVLK